MASLVTQVAAAESTAALQHFESRLTLETDCWDVHNALAKNSQDFVLLDVRSPDLYETAHIPGAINERSTCFTVTS
jgi:hypothetical protein